VLFRQSLSYACVPSLKFSSAGRRNSFFPSDVCIGAVTLKANSPPRFKE